MCYMCIIAWRVFLASPIHLYKQYCYDGLWDDDDEYF